MPSQLDGTYITVVSGMPRSGTSLMMRMLDVGGIPALTDGVRTPDEHNPFGYFEDERARRLARDSAWVEEARGKAVKIIYRLLPHLPPRLDYRVLFMERDINEIYASQQDMLESASHPAAGQNRPAMIRALTSDLDAVKRWLAAQSNLRSLLVPYAGLIMNPAHWSEQVAEFLDGALDPAAMAAVVDPALYRHRDRE